MCCLAHAQNKDRYFRYYVFDQTKNDQIDYEFTRDCVVYWQSGPPHMSLTTEYRIHGCAQKSFTYREEQSEYSPSVEQYKTLLTTVRAIDLGDLQCKQGTTCTTGLLNIGDKDYGFNNPLGDPQRDKLHAAVLSFLKAARRTSQKIFKHTIEGDFEPPREVTVEELLNSPAKYDGKRVRVTGYYYSESEVSCLADKRRDVFIKSVWVSNESSFSTNNNIQWIEDGRATIEGSYRKGYGRYAGGDIQRLTKFTPLDPQPLPPPPANQSSKRR